MNLQNLASMFSNSSTPLTAADLQKYQSAGLNMANFPSLPSVSTCLHLCTRLGMQELALSSHVHVGCKLWPEVSEAFLAGTLVRCI